MRFPIFYRRPEGSENSHPTPIEILINTIAGYISPVARQERHQKAEGIPAERQAAQERISRERAHYGQGFPVAGHGEPHPKNNPSLRHRSRLVP